MESPYRDKVRLGVLLGGLAAASFLVLFQLARHPETAVLFATLPGPAAVACNIRCVGIGPFLLVLGEGLKALLLLLLSGSFLYALGRTARRVLRTWSIMERAAMMAAPRAKAPGSAFLENVLVFADRRPLAFTAGFLRPKIFLSTGLLGALDENELSGVVLHEEHHRRSRDPLKGLAVSFIADFLFFLPSSRVLKRTYDLAAEMSADARSVAGRGSAPELAGSLLKVRRLRDAGAAWFFDPTLERAKRLLGEPSRIAMPLRRLVLAVVVLAAAAFIVLAPVKKSVTAMFLDHGRICALDPAMRSGAGWGGGH